jgi:CheY-like chemotaxis protein
MRIAAERLQGLRILIVEDDYFLAEDLAEHFRGLGIEVVGPAGTVIDALALLSSSDVEGAVLDVNLRGERVYPVAGLLKQKNIPFVFASGYSGELEPGIYRNVPRCIKPVDFTFLTTILSDEIDRRRGSGRPLESSRSA